MNTISDDQIETIERYLLNQLSVTERNDFETSFMEDPELFEEVQRQEAFISAFKDEKLNHSSKKHTTNRLTFLQWIMQPYSLASAFAFAIAILALPYTSLVGINPATDPLAISHVVSSLNLEQMRGSENQFVSDGLAPILVSIDLGPAATIASSSYRVSLADQISGQTTLLDDALQADSQGFLKIIVNQDLAGDYSINVFEFESDELVASYSVRFGH